MSPELVGVGNTGASVGCDGAKVGNGVGEAVGESVGLLVDEPEGLLVGELEGLAVGPVVGAPEGEVVGDFVGLVSMKSCVKFVPGSTSATTLGGKSGIIPLNLLP